MIEGNGEIAIIDSICWSISFYIGLIGVVWVLNLNGAFCHGDSFALRIQIVDIRYEGISILVYKICFSKGVGMPAVYISSASNGALECEIYNLSGQKLMAASEYGTHASMNLSELQKGVYILRVNGQIHKIVKE